MIKNLTMGGRTNRALLMMALVLALVAAVLTAVYLSQAKEDTGGGSFSGVVRPVVVAAQDIPARTRIDASMVTLKEIPEGVLLAGGFENVEDVVGQVTQVPIMTGEQVVVSKVSTSEFPLAQFGENPPLALVVQPGLRAVSVEVSSLVGAGGLIRPGDFVDVILSVEVQGRGGEEGRNQLARTILQNVQVLAIDQDVAQPELTEGADAAGGAADKPANPEATVVTLAVTPVHGEVLALADNCRLNFGGRLSLALRAFGDGEPVASRPVWGTDGPPPDCASLLGLTSIQ